MKSLEGEERLAAFRFDGCDSEEDAEHWAGSPGGRIVSQIRAFCRWRERSRDTTRIRMDEPQSRGALASRFEVVWKTCLQSQHDLND